MVKIVDRLLLFLYSIAVLFAAVVLLLSATGIISTQTTERFVSDVLFNDLDMAILFIIITSLFALISIRLLYVSLRRAKTAVPSIDQRTEFGDIRISIETVENLALKAAGRSRGVRDLRARVQISQSGLEVIIRSVVDGDQSIPVLTEEMQSNVKQYVEEITGIPVASVSVYVANIQQSAPAFKSRVE